MNSVPSWESFLLAACLLAEASVGCSRSEHGSEHSRRDTGLKARSRVDTEQLVSQMLGDKVENADGQLLGQVKDLVIESNTGAAVYALVVSGGFLGLGQRTLPVPARLLSSTTTKNGTLALDVSMGRWERVPPLSGGAVLAKLSSPEQASKIAGEFNWPPAPKGLQSAQRADPQRNYSPPLTPTGRNPNRTDGEAHPKPLKLAGEIIGMTVVNREHVKLGKVVDLLVDMSGHKPTLAIVLIERLLNHPERFAVRFALLRSQDRALVLDANRQALQTASPFDEKAWSGQSDTNNEIYRFDSIHGK